MGRSKRYVSAFLCFSLLPQLPRIALHFSHTIGEALEPKKATPRPIVDAGFLHRPRSEKSGQQHLPAHLSNLDSKKLERTPRSEAVCATSRRNNLSIAPKHRTSLRIVAPTPGSPAPRHRTSIHPLQSPRKTPFGWGVTLQMPARVLSSVARHWRDMSSTAFGGGSAGCCATSRAKDPCVTVLVWRSLVFVIVSAAFGCFSFWNISLTLIRLQATTTRFPTRAARRTRAFSSRRAVRWCLRWFRRVRQNKLPHHDCA